MYDTELTTQIIGYFLWKAGGAMPYLKILKLVYLADRKALLDIGETLTGDAYSAMKLGPAPYYTYNSLKQDKFDSQWLEHKKFDVRLKKEVNSNDPLDTFELLSPIMQSILDSIWDQYGNKRKYDLAKLTHTICPEWEACKDDSIELADILKAEGYTSAQIHATLERVAELNRLKEFSKEMQ
ncbi:Panacea domain-containing protein [uncultured Parasutterella sp.]|uniref:Panacea domain-containing protein n=1 Tax=uncultured Parasutterella sp. TaxID=1263098 RepID=UPI00272A4AC7|nr:Panacea domain-containing protein [uncultured Parasutterella sp.]